MDKFKDMFGKSKPNKPNKPQPKPKDMVVKGLQKALDICNTSVDLASAKAKIQAEIDGTA